MVHLVGFYYTKNHSCFIISKSWNRSSNFSRNKAKRLDMWVIFLVIVKKNNIKKFCVEVKNIYWLLVFSNR